MRAQTCTKWLADENGKKGEEDAAVEKNTHLSNRASRHLQPGFSSNQRIPVQAERRWKI